MSNRTYRYSRTSFRYNITTVVTVVSAAALIVACAPGGQSGGPPSSARNVVTAEELEASAATNLYDAIRRLRPTWLRSRSGSGSPVVFVDGIRAGGLNRLEGIYLQAVQEVRYVSPADATLRWGTGYPNGAIDVITRR